MSIRVIIIIIANTYWLFAVSVGLCKCFARIGSFNPLNRCWSSQPIHKAEETGAERYVKGHMTC